MYLKAEREWSVIKLAKLGLAQMKTRGEELYVSPTSVAATQI